LLIPSSCQCTPPVQIRGMKTWGGS
jgi:hypothetical protein